MLRLLLPMLCACSAAAKAATSRKSENRNPIVELEYTVHQGSLNTETDLYTFNNVPYAEPPIGERRFKNPVPLSHINRTVNDGSHGFMCRQSYIAPFVASLAEEGESPEETVQRLITSPELSEDCLYLDVVVPKSIFRKRITTQGGSREMRSCKAKAPVLVHIHGGGFTMGSKYKRGWDYRVFDPSGLIASAIGEEGGGIVYVSLNYRLGIFGFSNGGSGEDYLQPNVALQDQRAALEWVRSNIARFGGDPENITVMGQSAGATSILCHITGEGGKAKPLFRNAILQSIAPPRPVAGRWQRTLEIATRIAGRPITNGEELAALDAEALLQINGLEAFEGVTSESTGPTVDGDYIPDWPSNLLLQGKFDRNLSLILGQQSNESFAYLREADLGLLPFLPQAVFGPITDEDARYALTELYPPANETDLYETELARMLLLAGDLQYNCAWHWTARAYGGDVYGYRYQIDNGAHGEDLDYTFYTGDDDDVDAFIAHAMQTYLTTFAATGSPHNENVEGPTWPLFGEEASILTFDRGSIGLDSDDRMAERCEYWQKLAAERW